MYTTVQGMQLELLAITKPPGPQGPNRTGRHVAAWVAGRLCAGAPPRLRVRRRGRRLQRRGRHKHGRRPRQRGRGPHAQHRRPARQQARRCGRVARARATALPRRAAVIRAACCAASHEHGGAKPRTPRRQPTHATSSPLTARFCVPVPLSHAPVCSTHNARCGSDKPCRCNNALPSDRENLAHLRGLRGRRGGSGARRAPVGLRVAGGRGVLGHQHLHRRQRPGRYHAAVDCPQGPVLTSRNAQQARAGRGTQATGAVPDASAVHTMWQS